MIFYFLNFLLLSSTCHGSYYFDFNPEPFNISHACVVDKNDNSSCSFNEITDSFTFYRELGKLRSSNVSSITKINFNDCFLDNLPKELFKTFRNVEDIDASHTQIERLEHVDIMSQNKIKRFNASNNRIYKLGSKLTSILDQMESLDLSHNLIDRINPTVFTYSDKFKVLNLSHNRIEKLEKSFLISMKDLEILKFDHNKIREITGTFDHVNLKWKELHLQHNNLREFNPSLAISVSYLDLSLNKIEEARLKNTKIVQLFISNNNLKLLTISGNLEKLDASRNEQNNFYISFEDNKSLKHLDLSETKLKSKQDLMRYLKKLKNLNYLDLSYTQILLDENVFRGLESLETLKLSSAIVEQIPRNVFLSLKALKQLDISENSLSSFDINELKDAVNLESLNMRHSGIYKLNGWERLDIVLPNLREIDAYENSFKCSDFQNVVKKWKKMNMSVIELDEMSEDDYVRHSCIDDETHSKLHQVDGASSSGVIWYILGFLMMFAVSVGIVFAIKKFDIVNRTSDIVKSRASYSGGLLGDEEA